MRIPYPLIILFILLPLWFAKAEISPTDKATPPPAKDRVPTSFGTGKGFPKAAKGPFEAEGFGEEAENILLNRNPANQSPEGQETPKEEKQEISQELQLQRRVDVFYEGRVRFKNGASIWAVEDAGFSDPKLEVRGPESIDPSEDEASFQVFTNYFPFIARWQLDLYKEEELNSDSLLHSVTGQGESIYSISIPLQPDSLELGDKLYYVLRVFNDKGIEDNTLPKRILIEKRIQSQVQGQSDGNSESTEINRIWGQNSLDKQNIPLRGSKVRIVGANIPRDYRLNYRTQAINVDANGAFVIEEHFPIGDHKLNIQIQDQYQSEEFYVPFDMKVTGKYLFVVGIADFRFGERYLSEKVTGLSPDDTFREDVFVDGRLAFYLKGKVKGKYLITAQMDTTEGPVEDVFKGFHRKNSEALFRRLDPDRYYPVYGDNSNTFEDSPSQGRLYVKVEVDRSYLLWGNYNSDLDGTLFSQYNRTLYGAKLDYNSNQLTKFGDTKTQAKAFLSEPQTLFGHNEFLGTGGRVYTLRHNDVVIGSEKLVVEVRDRDSGLMNSRVALTPNKDYEFDYLAGRVVLNQALTTFALRDSDEIIDSRGTGNDEYFLVVDYEYNDNISTLSDATYGGRFQKWFGDYLSLGSTYVSETRDTTDYTLAGLDANIRLGQQSFVRIEGAQSESEQSQSNFVSNNGGLTFSEKPFLVGSNEKATAWGVESQIYLNDIIPTSQEGLIKTWYRNTQEGFSTARRQTNADLIEYGYDMEFNLGKQNILKSKITHSETGSDQSNNIYIMSYGRRFNNGDQASVEYRMEDAKNTTSGQDDRGQLLGLKYTKQFTPRWGVFAKAQTTLEEEGSYQSNDRYSLGTTFRISQKWEGTGEYGTGDRGDSAIAGLGYNIVDGHKVYANYDKSVDTITSTDSSAFTIGQKKRMNRNLNLYTENQFSETAAQAGVNQLYGIDYKIDRLWTAGVSYQEGEIEDDLTSLVTQKQAVNGTLIYSQERKITISNKASFVKNRGGENFDQFLVTSSLSYNWNRANTVLLEGDFSRTEDPNLSVPLARFTEANLGYAYRPVSNDRWNMFFRYTYLYDLDSQGQENARNDQRVNIFSLEGAYDLTRRWELGSRVAHKVGSERITRGTGPWIDTTLTFAQVRARYHLIKKWDALLEYRMVHLEETEDFQNGALLGIDYHLGGNLKLGVGFNFTNFNDDLTNFNFNSYGWYINIIGKL